MKNNLAIAILDGNLTRDPEMKKTKTNKTVTTFDLALNHEWGNNEGNKSVSYIQIETWEKLAEICSQYLKKGRYVIVEGRLRQDRWEDDNGKKQSRIKVLAQNVRFGSMNQNADREAA